MIYTGDNTPPCKVEIDGVEVDEVVAVHADDFFYTKYKRGGDGNHIVVDGYLEIDKIKFNTCKLSNDDGFLVEISR